MGLKPTIYMLYIRSFTKVNCNQYISINSFGNNLPSALADRFYRLFSYSALATFSLTSINFRINNLNQIK